MLKNEYEIINGVIHFTLYNKKYGKFECLVSEEHYDKLVESKLKWHLLWSNTVKSWYAKSTRYKGSKDGKPQYETVLMHRFLMDCPKDMTVDHLNYNTLDNRKCNLNVVTVLDNNRNKQNKANRGSVTGVRNVSYSKNDNTYIVQFWKDGKNIIMGRYDDLEDAKLCANNNRHKYYTNVS